MSSSNSSSSQPVMKDFHCRNRDCHAVLGTTNGFQLQCGDNAIFTLKVTITCRQCGQIRMWRPIMPGITPTFAAQSLPEPPPVPISDENRLKPG